MSSCLANGPEMVELTSVMVLVVAGIAAPILALALSAWLASRKRPRRRLRHGYVLAVAGYYVLIAMMIIVPHLLYVDCPSALVGLSTYFGCLIGLLGLSGWSRAAISRERQTMSD